MQFYCIIFNILILYSFYLSPMTLMFVFPIISLKQLMEEDGLKIQAYLTISLRVLRIWEILRILILKI